jgi:archaeal flagellin FlaB
MKVKRLYRRLVDQRGVTGLETAIILIAFVVVASVFAFTVLSTGVFSSERGKETVYAGLNEAQSSITPKGGIVVIRGDVEGTNAVTKVKLILTTAIAGNEIDLTPPNTDESSGTEPTASGLQSSMILSYADESQFVNDLDWTIDFLGKTNGDYILDEDEQAEITVWLHNWDGTDYNLGVGAASQYLTTRLGINTKFRLEIKPQEGTLVVLERTTPARLQAIINLN